MKRILIWTMVCLILSLCFGCSASPGPDNRTTAGPSKAVRNSEPNVNGDGSINPASQPGSFADRYKRKNRVDANPNATPAPLRFRPAPENSESASTMIADGSILEIRVFKAHPQLTKAEVNWIDPKEKSLKVYLKNGRVVEVKTDRIASLRAATSIEILEVAGIRTSRKNTDPSRLVDRK